MNIIKIYVKLALFSSISLSYYQHKSNSYSYEGDDIKEYINNNNASAIMSLIIMVYKELLNMP